MAFLFTLLFIITAYITPEVVFGSLAQYRVEVILALLAVVTSLPNIARTHFERSPQTYAFLAFCVAVPMSILSSGWISGAADAMYGFLPVMLCYLLPAANFRTRRHLQILTLAMLLCSSYFIYNGLVDLHNHVIPSRFIYGDGELRRIRGLGFVYDPNDLSQVLVSLLSMVFLWRSKNRILNIFLIGIPVGILVTGMYSTHSRGAALALMATLIVALRRKVGTVPAIVLAGSLFAASLAVGWSGGRDVSVEAGGDRLDAWSTGIQFIKSHPLFGVGASRFSDFNDITAHNSVVVCAAEIGLPGFICWVFLIFSAVRSGMAVNGARAAAGEEGVPIEANSYVASGGRSHFAGLRLKPGLANSVSPSHLRSMVTAGSSSQVIMTGQPMRTRAPAMVPPLPQRIPPQAPAASSEQQEEIRRIARLLMCSLTGFLVAGWFLSRALSMWLFLYIGTLQAVFRMAQDAGMRPRQDSFSFLLRASTGVAVVLLLLVYGVLKFRALTGG